jgi:hypothetical protein
MPCRIPVASRVEFVRGLRFHRGNHHQHRPSDVQSLLCHTLGNSNVTSTGTVFNHIAAAVILSNVDDDDKGSDPPAATSDNLLFGIVFHFILGIVLANPGLLAGITSHIAEFATIAAMDVLGRLHDAAALGSGLLCSAAAAASNYARRGSSAAFRRGWGLRRWRWWVQQRHGE